MRRAGLLAALIAAAVVPARPAYPTPGQGLSLSPSSHDFGMIMQGDIVETALVATNGSGRAVTVTLVPLCDCLSSSPASAVAPAGGSASFTLRYDSRDDTGITRKNFLVTSDDPVLPKAYVELRGTVRARPGGAPPPGPVAAADPVAAAGAPGGVPALRYYYSPGCRGCEEFLDREIPRLERSLGARIRVERFDILEPSSYERMLSDIEAAGGALRAVPVLVAGSTILQGQQEIEEGTRAALEGMMAGGPARGARQAAAGGAVAGLSVLAVAAAGLLDGINPCAFTTLVFLVAALAVAGRGRREVLVIGGLFTLAVFLTYLAVGFGLLSALRAATAVPVVSRVLRWVLVAVLVAFAGLSIYDWTVIRRGEPTKILLQLPSAVKRQIHRSIHAQARAAAVAGGALLLGFLVSVFEFACTGQVYLPTLAYLARARGSAPAAGLLVLYNACFIVPLLVVFAASALGVSSARIAALYQKRMAAVKLGLAAVFLGLAAVTVWVG